MTYSQTLDYLYSQLPMFHRVGAAAYKANLDNTYAICDLLKHPYKNFKTIHIAGTNGKGSTSHMLAAILQTAGYKTGLYTSPHLKDFRERIRVNGKMISKSYVTDFVKQFKKDFEKIQPSFFEWTVGLCFQYFSDQQVDIAVIETGLGGRLDSTNVITPIVSVITNIGWDHANLLGDTFEKIASEKAGIIKKNIPVVIGETQKTKTVFEKRANESEASIFFADERFKANSSKKKSAKYQLLDIYRENNLLYKNLQLDLTGIYQQKNVITVLQSIDLLKKLEFKIEEADLRTALKNVKKINGLMGRWQILSRKPLVVCDTGHNTDGIKYVLEQIKSTAHNQLHFVLGMVNDKDISSILKLLPQNAVYYFCNAKIPRALPASDLSDQAIAFNLKGKVYESIPDALLSAKTNAGKNDLIFIGGSTFTVAEAL